MKLQKLHCLLSQNNEESTIAGWPGATKLAGAGWQLGFLGRRDNDGCNLGLLLYIFDSFWGKAGLADPWAVVGTMKGTVAPGTSSAWNWFLLALNWEFES